MFTLRIQHILVFSIFSLISRAADVPPASKPCTIHSPSTGSFFDLRPLQILLTPTKSQTASNESYHAKGYDYPANFTLNFCGAVVEELEEVEDIERFRWANISAFYQDHSGYTYSIGQENNELVFRGKKLVMNYTMGSICPELDEDGEPVSDKDERIKRDELGHFTRGDDEEEDVTTSSPATSPAIADSRSSSGTTRRRKSTLLSFVCDTSPNLTHRPSISFVGTPDHCTYVFEVRSRYACAGATASGDSGTLGPTGVFAVILSITFLVYLIGGVVYQRNVMHQRGWRQLPNYSVWAGLFGFLSDMFVILFSSCIQRIPSMQRLFGGKRGYHRVGSEDGRRPGRGRTPDDENRLIDQLDEEWDD